MRLWMDRVNSLFSPWGSDSSPLIVGWVLYDWSNSVTIYPYTILVPLLINDLGDKAFGDGAGKIMWSYVSVVVAILTTILYLSVTALIEYENFKRAFLINCATAAAIVLFLFLFTFSPGAVYLAAIIIVTSICFQRVASVAYDSLLDCISTGKDPHQISTRGVATGYAGMLAFIVFILPILGIIYVAVHPGNLWLLYILPSVLAGVWYLFFVALVAARIPPNVYEGAPLPETMKGNVIYMIIMGTYIGFIEQLKTIYSLKYYPDLTYYIIGIAFISDAASAAGSAAVIIASDVLDLSLFYIGAGALVGVACAIIGLLIYKQIHYKDLMTPKHILLCCTLIICLVAVYVLYVDNLTGVFIVCVVAGTQIGAFSSFSRSIISRFLPRLQQSRFFSLYNLTQKGSSWLAPLIIGALTQAYGGDNYVRIVVFVTLGEVAIGIPFLLAVNVTRGEITRQKTDEALENHIHGILATEIPIIPMITSPLDDLHEPNSARNHQLVYNTNSNLACDTQPVQEDVVDDSIDIRDSVYHFQDMKNSNVDE